MYQVVTVSVDGYMGPYCLERFMNLNQSINRPINQSVSVAKALMERCMLERDHVIDHVQGQTSLYIMYIELSPRYFIN
jgi:hypothetical protein